MKRKVLVFVMTLAIMASLLGSSLAASGFDSEAKVSALAINVTKAEITDALSVFYKIDSITSSIEDVTAENSTFSATVHTSVDMTLLADSPEELPAVRGMLSAVGLDTVAAQADTSEAVTLMSSDISIAQLSAANPNKSTTEVAAATRILNDHLEEIRSYIGEQQNIHYYTKVSGTVENGIVTVTELLAEDGTGGYCSMSAVLPESPETIYNNYKSAMWPIIEANVAQTDENGAVALASSGYDRLAARDYARKWVYGFGNKSGEPSSKPCSVCGESTAKCKGYSVWDYYNSAKYTIYKNHNDCANFASQALAAGGMDDTGNTWKKDSTAWVNVPALENYLLNNGYLTNAGYSMAAAGGLIFCRDTAGGSPYHVEVIVANDTVTRQFCAHTHDRYNTSVSNDSNWKYYNINY